MEWEHKNDVATLQADAAHGNEYALRALERMPKVEWPGYWTCYQEITSMRQSWGMGVGPVPLDKLYWYAREVIYLEEYEVEAFVWVMRVVDARSIQLSSDKARSR